MLRHLFAAVVFCSSLSASAESLVEANMDWLTSHQEYVDNALTSEQSKDFLPVLNTVIAVWERRDGALTAEISPLILQAIIAEPELTFDALHDNPKSFNRWLKQLQGQVFTAINPDQVQPLNDLKMELETSLSSYIIHPDAPFKKQAKRLLEQVQAISVYMVD
ncbi:hypothetical protein KDW99_01525 [Marinomonas rhizomae]|uniref:hypothetical protein n=1 Tax=Marinomonas rhizomae TaxID=491948 RepID=UPI002102287D|nr:hypothetical protein [Marinomonas rhizomae]UTV99857.1 hypothetical protein KDW99_01525 [Marinomonas rhizomae]